MRVAASGGAPIAVTALDAARQETGHLNPWLLRDGRHFCYAELPRAGQFRLVGRFARCRPDAQPGARLVATLQGAVLAPGSGDEPDYVLFTRDGSLVAQAFDMKTLSLAGDATQIVERVASIRPLMRKRGPPTAVLSCVSHSESQAGARLPSSIERGASAEVFPASVMPRPSILDCRRMALVSRSLSPEISGLRPGWPSTGQADFGRTGLLATLDARWQAHHLRKVWIGWIAVAGRMARAYRRPR